MSVLKNPLCGGKIEKIAFEIKIQFAKYNIYILLGTCMSVLRNYVIILLQCIAYTSIG